MTGPGRHHLGRWVSTVAVVSLALAGCGDGSEQNADGGAHGRSPSTSATGATGAASPSGGAVTIEFTEKTRTIDSPYPVDITMAVPALKGARQSASDAFDKEFSRRQEVAIEELLSYLDYAQPYPDENCDAKPRGTYLVSTLVGETQTSSTDDGMASVTTLFTRQTGCSKPHTEPGSVTVDLATGRLVKLSDVADTKSATYRSAADRLARVVCDNLQTKTADLVADTTAFTPTADGLVLTWGNETISPLSCDVVSVTMPWSEAKGQQANPTAGASPKPKAAPCPKGAKLPKEIDPRVCGPVPAGAKAPTKVSDTSFGSGTVISSPTGNIVCDLDGEYGAMCYAREYSFKDPVDPDAATNEGNIGWVPNAMMLANGAAHAGLATGGVTPALALGTGSYTDLVAKAKLPYGQAAAAGTTVCLSQEIGMACWDAKTKHGFFLSKSQYAVW